MSASGSPDRKRVTNPLESRPSSRRIIGEGEMADLIRAFNWSETPLGPIEAWSDTLVTTVNLLLGSRHPMNLWWGPDLIQFYNDGYRPSIRADKHPSAVGQRGVACWPEIWPIIGPQIKSAMLRGESTWNTNQLVPINRNGKLEEVYWTYGYSPVRDKDGTVQGTLVVCSETTEQVLSERRLRALLGIVVDASPDDRLPESQPALAVAQSIVRKLDADPADIPFAALYLSTEDGILQAGGTSSIGALADSNHWPLTDALQTQAPLLLEDLHLRLGELFRPPWPEPLTRGYILPLRISGSAIQPVLVFGVSPRLPFDSRYQTFFHVVGDRIAALLQSEVHQLEIARAAKRFSGLVEANPFGMVIGSLNGKLKYANPAFLESLGYSQAEVNAGLVRWDNLTPPEYAEADARAVQQLLSSGRCAVYEKAYIARDGRHVPILLGATIIGAAGNNAEVAAFITDLSPLKTAQEALRKANEELEEKVAERTAALETEISDRKRAETNLRELTGRLLRAQDEERRHMARELHDHAGQTLAALSLNLSALLTSIGDHDPKIAKLAAKSEGLSTDLSREIRTLSYLLHPPLLDEVGLRSALKWYVDGFSERSKIAVDLQLPAQLARLPRELELVIFRVVQEALTNIHRHSESASARIHLDRSAGAVTFEITDRGKGIPPERQRDLAAKSGVGVRGMEERVRQFGGTLQIISSAKGTQVVVVLPLANPE